MTSTATSSARAASPGRPLSPGTVHRIHVVLHRAMAQALRWEWVWINPASNAKPPKYRPADIRPPSPEQVGALLGAVHETDPAFATFLRLAVTTGARRSQLLDLRWHDVDLDRAALSFTRAQVEGPHGPVLASTKTGTYRVELDGSTLASLRTHREMTAPDSDALVFARPDGTPWLPNYVTKRFIVARTKAELPHFRLHDLRHVMAPPRCSPPVYRSPPSRNGSATPERRRPSTCTRTRYRAATEPQRTRSRRSSDREEATSHAPGAGGRAPVRPAIPSDVMRLGRSTPAQCTGSCSLASLLVDARYPCSPTQDTPSWRQCSGGRSPMRLVLSGTRRGRRWCRR